MDNRDFWYYIRVATLPDFNPLLLHAPSHSPPVSWIDWFKRQIFSLCRFCYVRLHDLICSSLFGYLTLHEQLYIAVHQNNLNKARQCLVRGGSPNFIPSNPRMIVKNFRRSVSTLNSHPLDHSLLASIDAQDSMLYMAVSHNNFPLIKELVEHHDYGTIGHHTEVVSLCLAVKRGYDQIVEYLVDYAHIDPDDSVQVGCKHCKASAENIQRFQFPLYRNCSIEHVFLFQLLDLELCFLDACRDNHINIVKYLIATKNCNINKLTTSYETPLHGAILGAIENRFDTAINNQQRYHIVKYLLAQGDCNPNLGKIFFRSSASFIDILDNAGLNPLCVSLAHDNIYDYTSLLLNAHCHVDRLGWNYDERSNFGPHRPDCHLLYSLDHPLNICLNRLCPSGDSSHVVDYHTQRRNALNMIEHQPNIYAMADYGSKYPFLLAVQTGEKAIVQAMLKTAKDYIRLDMAEPLIQACRRSYYEIVQLLVDFGFNPNTIKNDASLAKMTNPSPNDLTDGEFLRYLDRYCDRDIPSPPSPSTSSPTRHPLASSYGIYEQQITPFLALARMNPWIFHPDKYESTMKTMANLVSHHAIDFSVRSNRAAFHYALLNEHIPLVYYCLAHHCSIDLLHSNIEFNPTHSQNHFSYTLFHLISLCCRLSGRKCIKRILLDSYAKHILRIVTYDRATSMRNVLAYMKLWFRDEDIAYDQTLFDHLVALPYMDDIFEFYDIDYLRTFLGEHSNRLIDYQSRTRTVESLKHLCRKNIRRQMHLHCELRQINLFKVLPQFDRHLPKSLRLYLVYSRVQSNLLINHLVDGIPWNDIQWM